MSSELAALVGVLVQLLGALYLAVQSFRTRRALSKFPSAVTYDTFSANIETLSAELRGQFLHQVIGFAAVLVGSVFQIYAMLCA